MGVTVSNTRATLASNAQGVVARWVDASNFVSLTQTSTTITLSATVAAAVVASSSVAFTAALGGKYALRVVVLASGRAIGTLMTPGGAVLKSLEIFNTAMSSGALATGKPGFVDRNQSGVAIVRYYDNFYAALPAPEPIVCYSGQTIEFRDKATLREDSTGVYYGDPPEYVGSRFKIPNAGGPARETRIAVIARRNDIETAADDDLVSNATTDSTTVTAFATPRFLAVPR